jgi:hypothetical protein
MASIPRGRLTDRKVKGGVVIVKEGTPGGLRKLRCPTSHGIAVPAIRADGTRVLRTPNGVEYVTKKL